jgi:hypothetical protein
MSLRRTLLAVVLANAALPATTITGPTITPLTINFSSSDPDAAPANGSSAASIHWTLNNSNKNGNWSLTVQSATPTLAGCPAVPVSAVQFQCTSVTRANGGDGNCASGSLVLSTSPQTVASGGKEGTTGATGVTLTFTFTDAWKYPASPSCSIQLTYTVNAQ